jgi:DNA-binding response OmpR family regulator
VRGQTRAMMDVVVTMDDESGRGRPVARTARGAGKARAPLTVLLVDPEAQRAHMLAAALQPACLVAIAPSAQVAHSIISQRCPDLVITDLDLPDALGVDFIERLRTGTATRHILLMVVTRRAAVRDKIAALRAGADEYLVWPCDPGFVVQRVRLLGMLRRSL